MCIVTLRFGMFGVSDVEGLGVRDLRDRLRGVCLQLSAFGFGVYTLTPASEIRGGGYTLTPASASYVYNDACRVPSTIYMATAGCCMGVPGYARV